MSKKSIEIMVQIYFKLNQRLLKLNNEDIKILPSHEKLAHEHYEKRVMNTMILLS